MMTTMSMIAGVCCVSSIVCITLHIIIAARNGSRQTKLLYITKTKTKNVNKKYNVWLRWTKPSHKPNPSNDHGVIMADIIEIRQGNDSDLKISIVCKSRTYVFEWSTPRERNCWLSVLQYVTAVCKN